MFLVAVMHQYQALMVASTSMAKHTKEIVFL